MINKGLQANYMHKNADSDADLAQKPNHRARELIAALQLQAHPEGGWYCEVFRSAAQVSCVDGRVGRSALTSIYFLLESDQHSQWHRVRSDEVWVYLEGDPLDLWSWDQVNKSAVHRAVGPVDAASGRRPQHTIAAGIWQAAKPAAASCHGYTLVACMVGPGFDFTDFTLLEPTSPEAAEICQAGLPVWPSSPERP